MARPVTSCGDRIAASALAGTLYLRSNQNEILELSGCGSILRILPTGTPRMRTSSPANTPLLLSKYATTIVRADSPVARIATITPATNTRARAVANTERARRSLVVTAALQAAPRPARAVGRRAAGPAAPAGADSADRRGCR